MTIYVSKGDENPDIKRQLLKADDTPIDIPNTAEVYFVVNDQKENVELDREVDVYRDRNQGKVTVKWGQNETDLDPGVYKAVFVIEEQNGDETTVPNVGAIPLKVDGDSDLTRT